MKRVLSIQDLSCLGKCSLTVALPILSAMGCSCSVLPTAVLSTHTAFPAPHIHSLTEDMVPVARHWQSIGAQFDAVTVGYLSDARQMDAVEQVLALFSAPVILDPVMADHGMLYSGMTQAHVEAMGALCRKAEYLLPNVTEAALLTGLSYRETGDEGYLQELCAGLLEKGAGNVIITGVNHDGEHTGFYAGGKDWGRCYRAQKIHKSQHGTGDMFCAVFTGSLLSGQESYDAAARAAGFVERVVANTNAPDPFGAAFEPELPWLMNMG